jgi:aryl sulfotransferase
MRAPLVRYRSWSADSARWDGFAFRAGDILISAPVKCGTTWVQTICALLIFQKPELPTTLDRLSPWVDMLTRPLEEVFSDLEAQRHRRILKSHTPLDGLPLDERVTYICIGRDPRDVALSFDTHMANMDMNSFVAARQRAASANGLPPPSLRTGSQRDRFWQWVDDAKGLRAMVHHLATFWDVRHRPNIVLLHYGELQADLMRQMQSLADRLGAGVSAQELAGLAQAATFDSMRQRADQLVPNAAEALWHDNARFFNKGTSGQWRHLLDDEDLRRYQARIDELAAPDLVHWMHQGSVDTRRSETPPGP